MLKKNTVVLSLLFALAFFYVPESARSQLSAGGTPPSTLYNLPWDPTYLLRFDPPDMEKVRLEDESSGGPYRFGIVLPADIGIPDYGYWNELPDGGSIWRYSLSIPGAKALTVYFDRFYIPEGGRLFLYNPEKTYVIGAFTPANNTSSHRFATELIPGECITLEYYRSAGSYELPELHIDGITYAYRDVRFLDDRGTAGECEVNINCPEGTQWQKQKRGVVRIQVKKLGGNFWCSGSLVNNTRWDHMPYILTADHCGANTDSADLQQWVFYFNYERPFCDNTGTIPAPQSMTGAILKARGGNSGYSGSDFFLVLLNENVPDNFYAYYLGWNREDVASPSGTTIHHPQGDVKKISTYTVPLVTSNWIGGIYQSHWKVVWAETVSGHGVTEGGSSGSPLFDNYGRIVGTLTGGDSSCDSIHLDDPDYYGKFFWHWDKNGTDSSAQLSHWLDPDNAGPLKLDGFAIGIGTPVEVASLKVYPNPFYGQFTVEPETVTGSYSLSVQDIFGKRVLRSENHDPGSGPVVINATALTAGIYFLEYRSGNDRVVRKIVKLETP